MAGRTLYDKIWETHAVGILPTGQTQLFIGLHLIHEITTAPAFDMLREQGMDVAFRDRTFATVDHIVPTDLAPKAISRQRSGRSHPGAGEKRRAVRRRVFRPGQHEPRDRACHRATARVDPTGHDPGMRRQPHEHPRRLRHPRLRHRHEPGARCAGDANTGDGQTQSAPNQYRRRARHRRLCQGRDSSHHSPARRGGRQRIRLRIRRRGYRPHEHGRAHDRVQHEHRGRRAGRLCQSGSDHLRLSQGPSSRADGSSVRASDRLLEIRRFRRGCQVRRRCDLSREKTSNRP